MAFLPSFGAGHNAGICLLGPGNGLVNFAFLLGDGPWLSSDSHKGLRFPQGSRTIDTEVVVA